MSEITKKEKDFIKELQISLSSSSIYCDKLFIFGTSQSEGEKLKKLHEKARNINQWYKENVESYSIMKHIISDEIERRLTNYELVDEGKFKELNVYPELANSWKISRSIYTKIKKLPYPYKVFIPLIQSEQDQINIRIAPDLRIKCMPFEKFEFPLLRQYSGYGLAPVKNTKYLTLVGKIYGYISQKNYKRTETTEVILYKTEILIGLLFIFDFLEKDYSIYEYEPCKIIFTNFRNKRLNNIELDKDLSDYILKTKIQHEVLELYNSPKSQIESNEKVNLVYFTPIFNFLLALKSSNTDLKNYVTKLANSVIWFLYGISSMDPKKSVVYLIISLEALVRSSQKSHMKSENIAEMCSFLLSNNVKERNDIEKRINDIYNLRNSLAHSGKSIMNGKNLSREEINREVEYLKDVVRKLILLEFNKLK